MQAHDRRLPARKLWIAFAQAVAGTVVVDDGARRALVERDTSLLPAGVTEVRGTFDEGDTVDVRTQSGEVVRPGHGARRRGDARSVAGTRTSTYRRMSPTRSSTGTTS